MRFGMPKHTAGVWRSAVATRGRSSVSSITALSVSALKRAKPPEQTAKSEQWNTSSN